MSFGKGSNKTTTKTTAEPWSGVQPYLKQGYSDLGKVYAGGAPEYYPGQTVAPMSNMTSGALNQLAQRGAAGSPVTDAASAELQKTLGGDYLNGETPGFQGALSAAIRPISDNYTKNVIPNIESAFSEAGRYGGAAHQGMEQDAYSNMNRDIGDVSSQMSYQNYGDERQRQMQGMLFAPEMANQDYRDIEAQGQAGAGYDQYNQNVLNADIARHDYNQNKDLNWIGQNLGMLSGTPWGQTSTQQGAQPSVFSGALSGGLAGGGIASLLSSTNPLFALGGAGLGALSSLFG